MIKYRYEFEAPLLFVKGYCPECPLSYVDTTYPIRINGEECTPEECEKLMKEIAKYDKAGEQE